MRKISEIIEQNAKEMLDMCVDRIIVELSRKELKKMCDSCITKCKQTDNELVDCNLICAKKFKVVK